jgi:hypothetical protein
MQDRLSAKVMFKHDSNTFKYDSTKPYSTRLKVRGFMAAALGLVAWPDAP